MAAKKRTLPAGWTMMVANHSFRLHGGGHTIQFNEGVEMPVPPALQPQAMAHGAKAVEGEAIPELNPHVDPRKDPSSPEYRGAVRAAAESILARNSPSEFGANGKPYANIWDNELGWRPMQAVREEIWDEVKNEAFRAAKAS